ncbi:MAG: hypothetical protein JRI25_26135, partial [Deltaproteobacteria bacterium]|nr:hypothetical protein [Deltaproteobacteria bacterium]
DRDDLRQRIDLRLRQMMERGYLEEVRGLLAAGWSRDLKPMQSLGYKHLADHLLDGLLLEEAVDRTVRGTWQLARKQRNWMRSLGFRRVGDDPVAEAVRTARDVFRPA